MPVHAGNGGKFRFQPLSGLTDTAQPFFDVRPCFRFPASEPGLLGGAQVPSADPGPKNTIQSTPAGAGVAAAVLPGGDGLCRRRGSAGQMEKQQVLCIEPDFCPKTARVRAPRAGLCAQLVHDWMQGRHLGCNIPRKAARPFHFPVVVPDFPADPTLNPLPCPWLRPGNRLFRNYFLHCSAVRIGPSREAVKPVRWKWGRSASRKTHPFGGSKSVCRPHRLYSFPDRMMLTISHTPSTVAML